MEEFLTWSAIKMAAAIRNGKLTSEQLVSASLARIDAINPRINAVTVTAPDALRFARQADADLAAGTLHGPLHGVPFAVKDVFAVPGLYSKLDTHVRQRRQPQVDATVIARMRTAGAVLVAKTNCPPNGSGTDTENATYGRTLNPYDLTRSPGGSSGGDAALVAACAVPISLGSDLKGGLRVPAHYCGVATLKPTSGRVPCTGAYNQPGGLTDPRTQIGPLARHVQDLTPVLKVILGPDYADSGVVPMPLADVAALKLQTLRVAFFLEDETLPVTRETANAVGAAAQALARSGVTVVGDMPPHFIANSTEIDSFWQSMAGAPGRTWVELFAMWDYYRSDLLNFLTDYDAILCPVDHHQAPLFRNRDEKRFGYTVPFSLTGYPCTVVRVGQSSDGLPVGVQIAAHPWREDVALALAAQVEQAFGGWQMPAGL